MSVRVLRLSDGRSCELPWEDPGKNLYFAHDGPVAGAANVSAFGHDFRISPTWDGGIHSGRNRYKVECLTCGELIHEGSTSATAQLRYHIEARP